MLRASSDPEKSVAESPKNLAHPGVWINPNPSLIVVHHKNLESNGRKNIVCMWISIYVKWGCGLLLGDRIYMYLHQLP